MTLVLPCTTRVVQRASHASARRFSSAMIGGRVEVDLGEEPVLQVAGTDARSCPCAWRRRRRRPSARSRSGGRTRARWGATRSRGPASGPAGPSDPCAPPGHAADGVEEPGQALEGVRLVDRVREPPAFDPATSTAPSRSSAAHGPNPTAGPSALQSDQSNWNSSPGPVTIGIVSFRVAAGLSSGPAPRAGGG